MIVRAHSITKIFLALTIFTFMFLVFDIAHAQLLNPDATGEIKSQAGVVVGDSDPDSAPDPRIIAFFVIQVFLSVLGTFFMGLTLMSGYYFFTARGQEDKITKAQDTMRRAIIGLIIIFTSFGIVRFALLNIQGAVNEGYEYYEDRQYINNETNSRGQRVLP